MIRNKPASAMQKTYDDCYLICSTAVYFESQNNEAEALRSWRNALDQIYYHNAYRVSSNYRPRSETEKALQESLHQLELQCKERVDLLEALKQSREDAAKDAAEGKDTSSKESTSSAESRGKGVAKADENNGKSGWLGGGTVPPINYPDISRPPLPKRPVIAPRRTSGSSVNETARAYSYPRSNESSTSVNLTVTDSQPDQRYSRTPSPEKRGKMLRTLRPGRDGSRPAPRIPSSLRTKPPAAAKAATQAWGIPNSGASHSSITADTGRDSLSLPYAPRASSARSSLEKSRPFDSNVANTTRRPSSGVYNGGPETGWTASTTKPKNNEYMDQSKSSSDMRDPSNRSLQAKIPPTITQSSKSSSSSRPAAVSNTSKPVRKTAQPPTYRKEYLPPTQKQEQLAQKAAVQVSVPPKANTSLPSPQSKPRRKAVPILASQSGQITPSDSSLSNDEPSKRLHKLNSDQQQRRNPSISSDDDDDNIDEVDGSESAKWKAESDRILKNLSKGIDETAARQILNEIVIQGDEVHWNDVAGLNIAKDALKETVVYPFLRPDLFMGLREPARGMLLFGPPGTGKTMLARAVATESRSTFFAISASSLTSKFLGESEKLVRALFALAKAMAPSIIFVDEIDSLLSARSGTGEHEATRRIKTEFLIQWSDLARAAAGREQSDKDKERGDASRVLVLAATNLPWDIDEAARRRFVRRQYIPLPEGHVRKSQLETLLGHQKHRLTAANLDELVALTDGFSGSDITALAKDAAMGPLRSLGEKLLHMTMDEIRPIQIQDFKASLSTIRPSVSKEGLKQFEEWAREFGERGG